MKIVLNKQHGGFGLSKAAYQFLNVPIEETRWGIAPSESFREYDKRTDKRLIECVERLRNEASNEYANLCIIEIPDGSHFKINDYDGYETIYYSKTEIGVE